MWGNSSLLIIHKDRYFGKISRTVSVSLKLVEEIVDFGYTTKQFWPYCLNSVCTRAIRCLGSKRCLSKINIFEFFLYSENSFRAIQLIKVHLIFKKMLEFALYQTFFWPYWLNLVCKSAIRYLGSRRRLSKISNFWIFSTLRKLLQGRSIDKRSV